MPVKNITICPNVIKKSTIDETDSSSLICILLSQAYKHKICIDVDNKLLDEYKLKLKDAKWDFSITLKFLEKLTEWILKEKDFISPITIKKPYTNYLELVLSIADETKNKKVVVNNIDDYSSLNTTWFEIKDAWTIVEELKSKNINNFSADSITWVQVDNENSTITIAK